MHAAIGKRNFDPVQLIYASANLFIVVGKKEQHKGCKTDRIDTAE